MIRGIDLNYQALRQYKRALFRGDHQAATQWLLILDRQLDVMERTMRLQLVIPEHHATLKKSHRRNRLPRSRIGGKS